MNSIAKSIAGIALASSLATQGQTIENKTSPTIRPDGVVITITKGELVDSLEGKESFSSVDSIRRQEELLNSLLAAKNISDGIFIDSIYRKVREQFPDLEIKYTTYEQNQLFIDYVQAYPDTPTTFSVKPEEKKINKKKTHK